MYRTIGKLALPLLLGQFGNIAVGFADNIMVGHYSTDALASASFVNNVFNIAIFSCVGFTYGLTPLVGALYSQKRPEAIGRMMRDGVKVNTIFTILVSMLMLGLYFNLEHLGQPEHLLPIIKPYYLIVLCGMLPVMLFNVLAQWSYAINNTGIPTWIVLSANVLNVIGNYSLIYGNFGLPEMGLFGAGISTLVARIITALAMCWVFFGTRLGKPYMEGFYRGKSVEGQSRHIAHTGFPVGMQMCFETAAFSGAAVMSGWLGRDPLAAFQIVTVSGMLGFCIYYSIGAATAIPLSHAAGQGDVPGMRKVAWTGYRITLAAMAIVITLFLTCGEAIMSVFSDDPKVLSLAFTLLGPMAIYQFGDASQIAFANAMRGTSRVTPMLFIAFFSYIIIGLPVTYLFAFPLGMGLYGIVLSFSVSLIIAGAFYLYYFMKATRKNG